MVLDIINTGDRLGDLLGNTITLSDSYEKYVEYIVYNVDNNKFYLLDPSYNISIGPCDSLEELKELCGFS